MKALDMREFDLDRYAGKWFEIASFPFIFQSGCKSTTAEYSFNDDGTVLVVNKCERFYGTSTATGRARKTPEKGKLKVSFSPLYFPESDYIVEFVDDKYQHAIVGSEGKRYLWILSRKKRIDPSIYSVLVKIARRKGYTVAKLKKKY